MTPLLIVGASGRAAAATLRKRGFAPHVIDLFGDLDTQRIAESVTVCDPKDYPHGFIDPAKRLPRMSWVYTGGLENHPDVVEAISVHHDLTGSPPAVLNRVRDPFELGKIVRMPRSERVLPDDGVRWLRKPCHSAGGKRIWRAGNVSDRSSNGHVNDCFFQVEIDGDAVSAAFHDQRMLGTSRLLHGQQWLHAAGFEYCGNITDSELTRERAGTFHQMHETLRSEFCLRGDWGVDCIANADGLWVLEVNPRYCASFELFEQNDPSQEHGKAIYYAPRDIVIPANAPFLAFDPDPLAWTPFADIPAAGTVITKGDPVVTLHAAAATTDAVLATLKAAARGLDTLFGVTP